MLIDSKINVNLGGILNETEIPPMYKIVQTFSKEKIEDIDNVVYKEISNCLNGIFLKDKKIAITIGSRGINKLDKIVFQIIKYLKDEGALPFIIPAMGSHAGGTEEGQKEMLHKMGFDEETMSVPVISSMDVVKIGEISGGTAVYCDRNAFESDGIIVLNKIKPHADFKGEFESGLVKMMAIGLGKHKGASSLHNLGFDRFKEVLPMAGKIFLENAPILCGIGIIENAYDEPSLIECIKKENIMNREKELLKIAKANVATIKTENIDVLIIDEIGKNISGEGMDPNVTGRPGSFLNEGFIDIKINKIVVRGVTEVSCGNGAGIGMADITTLKCVSQLDLGLMYTNSITATILAPSKLPIILNNDEEAIKVAIKTSTACDYNNIRLVHIKNTLNLDEIYVSKAVFDDMINNNENIPNINRMVFDEDGYFLKYDRL